MNVFKNKYFLFALISGIILLVIVTYVIILSFNSSNKTQQSNSQSNQVSSGKIAIRKIDPSESKDLPSGKPYAFSISFETPVNISKILLPITYFYLPQDSEAVTL
mgnify:FL=1